MGSSKYKIVTRKQHLALLSKGINNSMTSLCNLKRPWSHHRKYQLVVNNLNLWLWAGCIDFFLIFFFTRKGQHYKHRPVTTHSCTLPFQHNVGAGWLVPRCPIYPYFHHLSTSHQVKEMQIIYFERSEKSGRAVACIDFLYHLVYSFQGEWRTHVSNGHRFFFVLSRWFWRK